MSEEIEKIKDNAETRYVRYCYDWFGLEINTNDQFVQVDQWKLYRIAGMHMQYRMNYYIMFAMVIVFMFLYLWSLAQ